MKSERHLSYLILAFASYLAVPVSTKLSAVFGSFVSDFALDGENFWALDFAEPARLFGYALTGIALGFVIWWRFKETSPRIVILSPLILLLARLLNSLFSYLKLGRGVDDVPFGKILGIQLTSMSGLSLLVVIPAFAYATTWFLEKRSQKTH